MNFLNLFKKKPVSTAVLIPVTVFGRDQSKLRHRKLIENLTLEYETLAYDLQEVEAAEELTKSEKEKHSNRIIFRMTLIKYEIEIREGLLQWL